MCSSVRMRANLANSLPIWSWGIPSPWSVTSTAIDWLPRSRQRTLIDPPSGEYLTAFVTRLVRTWRNRSGSAKIFGNPAGMSISTEWSESPRGTASRMKGPRSTVSIWVMSRVSLASRARCSVSLMTVRMNSCRVSTVRSGSSSTSSANPRIAIRGRRKSWATIPTNSLFRRSYSWSRVFAFLISSWRRRFSTATVACPARASSRFRSSSLKGVRPARSATIRRPRICGPRVMGATMSDWMPTSLTRSVKSRVSAWALFETSGPFFRKFQRERASTSTE